MISSPSESKANHPPAAGHEPPPILSAVAAGACLVFLLAGWATASVSHVASLCLYVLAYLCGGAEASVTAIRELVRGRLSVDLLMILAAAGAAVLGDWGEGAVLLFLFSTSGALEAYAMYRTTRSIDALVKLRPRDAARVANGVEARIPIDDLNVGDVLHLRPGERFPVDGEVVEGTTHADESTLTGESVPVPKEPGNPVFAATINGRGSVLVRMTRATADTTLERIVRMVKEAQAEKTDAQKFVESWRGPYVVGVLLVSSLVFAGALAIHGDGFRDAFYHAMVILVVASPCAVVVGSPAVLLSAIARGARRGVLFKGGAHLEMLAQVDVVAFDKTGTITPGKPRVTEIWTAEGFEASELVRLAAAVERRSEHHLAEAVLVEAERLGLTIPDTTEFESHVGLGVHAIADGIWIGVGREAFFAAHGKPLPAGMVEAANGLRAKGNTALMVVTDDGRSISGGVLALADAPRPDAAAAIRSLRDSGIGRIIILTGDHEGVARAVCEAVGADEFRAGLMPNDKVTELRRLRSQGRRVAMIGDGVNDAPALATADVGIAMGAAGTDVALEVADVVLMRDDLNALAFAVGLSRTAKRRVHQNLGFAFGMIGFLLISSFFGLPLWMGVVGHEGSTLLVVLNGLRMLWGRMGNSRD